MRGLLGAGATWLTAASFGLGDRSHNQGRRFKKGGDKWPALLFEAVEFIREVFY
jgi:hypothetical protein